MNVLILARGGSKGVPNKNIKLLAGKPLLAYPIEAVKKTKWIENIFVSTDSEIISSIAKEYGAQVIDRPKYLAQDKSLDVDGFRHAVEVIGSVEPLVHLRATTPLVMPSILTEAVELFKNNQNTCTSLRSAQQFQESIYKFFKKEGEFWAGFFPGMEGDYYNLPRQSFPANYLPNGYIDIVKPEIFMKKSTFHGDKILSFITPYVIEVDCEQDFQRLEQEVKNNHVI